MARPKRNATGHGHSQAALEYLMSYAWAILIIAVVTALFFLYLRTPSSLPSSCNFSNGFYCKDIILQSNTITHNTFLTIALTNAQAYAIGNPKLFVSINTTNTTTFACFPSFVLPGAGIFCTANIPISTNIGVLLAGDMYLNATYCGLLGNYIYTANCVGAPRETYHGTFTGHTETQISTIPSLTLNALNLTQYTGRGKDPLKAVVELDGYPISGATVNFTVDNPAYTIYPVLTDTNSSGVALSYIWGPAVGTATVTAKYTTLEYSVAITFVAPPAGASTTSSIPTVATSSLSTTSTSVTSTSTSLSTTSTSTTSTPTTGGSSVCTTSTSVASTVTSIATVGCSSCSGGLRFSWSCSGASPGCGVSCGCSGGSSSGCTYLGSC